MGCSIEISCDICRYVCIKVERTKLVKFVKINTSLLTHKFY